jgi:lipopolysaccharide transport system ATP-binding protein
VSLLGPNGAGKSTMLKMLNGLIRPDGGTIRIRGRVGALIELGAGFNPVLTGRENVYINGAVLGLNKRQIDQRFQEIVEFSDLGHVIDTPVQTYSSGMRVRLGFSVAAHLRPQLMLIDEVLAVGDVGFRLKCLDRLQQLSREGVSIIIVTHAVNMLARLSNRAIVFGSGRIEFDGDLARGISTYERLLDVRQTDREQELPQGSGLARIVECEVQDGEGKARGEFRGGESVRLRIGLQSDAPIRGARLVVSLNSPSAGVIATCSTADAGLSLDVDPEGTSLLLEWPALPLTIGAYNVTLSLLGPRRADFYHRRIGVGRFSIVGNGESGDDRIAPGVVKLPHAWLPVP